MNDQTNIHLHCNTVCQMLYTLVFRVEALSSPFRGMHARLVILHSKV